MYDRPLVYLLGHYYYPDCTEIFAVFDSVEGAMDAASRPRYLLTEPVPIESWERINGLGWQTPSKDKLGDYYFIETYEVRSS